jgi:hypothetical protein
MDVARHLRWQAGWCKRLGSPLYGHLLERAAVDVEAGGVTAVVLGDRDATERSMLGLRLMGAVHRLVLEGRAPALAAHYPSAGGDGDHGRAWLAFEGLVAGRPDEIGAEIERPVQTNEVGRAAALVGGFLEVAGSTGLPLRILEVGASAGLLLRWDRFFYEARGSTWGPPASPVRLCSFNGDRTPRFDVSARVVVRKGCDVRPVDPTTEEGRLTLLAYVWADQVARHRILRAALAVARDVPALVDRADLVGWVHRNLHPEPGVATIVYHSIVMQYLSESDRAAFEQLVADRAKAASRAAPLAWLRMEPGGDEAEVRLTIWPGGEERLVATSGFHGQNVNWNLRRVVDESR